MSHCTMRGYALLPERKSLQLILTELNNLSEPLILYDSACGDPS